MKNFLYSMVCLSALAFTFSACSEDKNDDPQNPGGGGTDPVQLTTPAVTATGGEGQFTAQWAAVENATSYTIQYGDKEEKTTETTITKKNVAAGDYTIRVKATTDKAGYIDSEWGQATVTVTESQGGGVSDGTWTGTWTVTSSQTLSFEVQNNQVQESITDTPKEFEIYIEEVDLQGQPALQFTGWSILTDQDGNAFPGIALAEEGTNNLQLVAGISFGEAGTGEDGEPVEALWAPVCESNGQITWVTGQFPAYTFVMDGDNAAGTAYEGQLDSGQTFKVKAFDIFGLGNYIYFMAELPFELPAGDMTMVKTANASGAPEKAYAKAFEMPSMIGMLNKAAIARASVFAAAVR